MLRVIGLAAVGVTLLAAAAGTEAAAAPGVASGNVNLRTGPGTGYARIATIPAGAQVNVLRCGGWCEVVYNGRRGWASAAYIARGNARAPRGGYVFLPDPSLCHGPQAWSLPFCETPLERSMRDFEQSNQDWNARQRGRR